MEQESSQHRTFRQPRGNLWHLIQSIIAAHTTCGIPYEVLVPPESAAYEYFSEVLGYLPALHRKKDDGKGQEREGDQDGNRAD